jgi:hypothetical protein
VEVVNGLVAVESGLVVVVIERVVVENGPVAVVSGLAVGENELVVTGSELVVVEILSFFWVILCEDHLQMVVAL